MTAHAASSLAHASSLPSPSYREPPLPTGGHSVRSVSEEATPLAAAALDDVARAHSNGVVSDLTSKEAADADGSESQVGTSSLGGSEGGNQPTASGGGTPIMLGAENVGWGNGRAAEVGASVNSVALAASIRSSDRVTDRGTHSPDLNYVAQESPPPGVSTRLLQPKVRASTTNRFDLGGHVARAAVSGLGLHLTPPPAAVDDLAGTSHGVRYESSRHSSSLEPYHPLQGTLPGQPMSPTACRRQLSRSVPPSCGLPRGAEGGFDARLPADDCSESGGQDESGRSNDVPSTLHEDDVMHPGTSLVAKSTWENEGRGRKRQGTSASGVSLSINGSGGGSY